MFRDCRWKAVYRSDGDSLLEDFYIPALSRAVRYDRAVGFFSAAMLSYAAQGLSAFVSHSGRMRLIFGGELDYGDSAAIEHGYALKELSRRFGVALIPIIDDVADALSRRRLEVLSWLVATGGLEVKVALKPRGMYHEKIGVFTDESGDKLVFQGSANESANALLPDLNFESINVFPSWRPELTEHADPYVKGFEALWNNTTRGTLVIDFPEAARERLVEIGRRTIPVSSDVEARLSRELNRRDAGQTPVANRLRLPDSLNGQPFRLKEHQRAALQAWRANDLQGIFALATGAGKTITALAGITAIYERVGRLFVVVAVPYQALADQWMDEFARFGVAAIGCYAGRSRWYEDLGRAVTLFSTRALPLVACVVVNRTLSSAEFQAILSTVDGKFLAFIGDECHHHGAENLRRALPTRARLRIGLSATPKHYLDAERTARITSYYGPIVAEYSLKQALGDGVLTPYDYHVHIVELDDDEAEVYLDLTQKISRMMAGGSVTNAEDAGTPALKMLLLRRARLLGSARKKIPTFQRVLSQFAPQPFSLIYCGDGSTAADDFDSENSAEEDRRQLDDACRVLNAAGWRVSTFTAQESRPERQEILESFRAKSLDALVAIRCLDEGIDIPDCRLAFILASSRNPKQFIQRRGRILRRASGKEFAVIHDFFTVLRPGTDEIASVEKKLVTAELARIAEFARLARNFPQVARQLEPITKRFDVAHYLLAD
jgi:superfamily II DNA or RNA helicase